MENKNLPLKISRILHAGYVFECGQTVIAFDPIFENPFSTNCYAFPNVIFDYSQIKKLKFDAVFISHFHDDHCSLESLNYLDKKTPIYFYCQFEDLFKILNELGFTTVYPIKLDCAIDVGRIKIIPRRALDADVDSIFQIKAAGNNVLNIVDSWIDFETLELLSKEAPWDMILWPFQTMRELEVLAPSRAAPACRQLPEEWLEQLKKLAPKFIVPSSCQFQMEAWSWYNKKFFPIEYKQFAREVQSLLPEVEIIRLNPSISIEIHNQKLKFVLPLPWIKPLGQQDLDYQYLEELMPPSTAEIAKNFPKLSQEQMETVINYCKLGLLEKYKSMDLTEEKFFNKSRIWKLSVYDHNGESIDFYYILDPNIKIEALPDTQLSEAKNNLAWMTEVPIAKLYAALELGEALTSMYVRINDIQFNSEIENEIQNVDVLEDPLVRCLFNGAFGSYQKAQLKKLKFNLQS